MSAFERIQCDEALARMERAGLHPAEVSYGALVRRMADLRRYTLAESQG